MNRSAHLFCTLRHQNISPGLTKGEESLKEDAVNDRGGMQADPGVLPDPSDRSDL